MKKSNKYCRVACNHTLRFIYSKERKERNLPFKGVGVWECIECDEIIHSM